MESKRNIARYIFAFGGVQGLNVAIGLVRNKLVALLLGPNGMGVMALYSSTVQLVQNACNLGLDKSSIPDLSRTYEGSHKDLVAQKIGQIRSLFVVAALMAFVFMIIASWILSLLVFSELGHTIHFIVLSPAAPLLILCAGEMSIMKATHQLRRLALLSVLNIVISLIVSIPMFFVWRAQAIIPSIVLTALTQALVILLYSYRRYPLKINISRKLLAESSPMIRLGMAFVVASTIMSGSEFLTRTYLYNVANDTVVGLYNAAYMIAFSYAGMVFSAIDVEYFPRLSQITDTTQLRATILRQIKVCIMIIVPMVAVLIVLLPWLVPLLFSRSFIDAVPVAQVILLAMIFRAIYLPIGYLSLAKGDSHCFLFLETCSAVWLLAGVVIGYHCGELLGCGVGLVIANALDMVINIVVVRLRFGIRIL